MIYSKNIDQWKEAQFMECKKCGERIDYMERKKFGNHEIETHESDGRWKYRLFDEGEYNVILRESNESFRFQTEAFFAAVGHISL